MTNPTPHGQVPEALRLAHIFDNPLPPEWPDMVAAAAELRRQHARIAELEAVGAGGVQALSAAPADIAKLRHLYANLKNGGVRDTAQAKRIADGLLAPIIERLERATPKAAPGEQNESAYQRGYMDGMAKGRRDAEAAPQQEAQEPVAWLNPWRADQVTTDYDAYGERGIPLYTAPQPAPAPLSDDAKDAARYRWLRSYNTAKHPEVAEAFFLGDQNMDAAIDAALAAQGGQHEST